MRTKHVLLSLLMLIASLVMMSAQTVKQLNSPEVSQLLKKNPKIVVLDVRTPEEFAMGHIKGAKNIDIRQSDFYARVDKLTKNVTMWCIVAPIIAVGWLLNICHSMALPISIK